MRLCRPQFCNSIRAALTSGSEEDKCSGALTAARIDVVFVFSRLVSWPRALCRDAAVDIRDTTDNRVCTGRLQHGSKQKFA